MRRRYIQDPKSMKLIPIEDWRAPAKSGLQIIPDIEPYKSMVDGSIITSRSHHRSHLREHGMIEVGNEKLPEPKYRPAPGLKRAVINAANTHLKVKK
jgi:hypothetical protein